MELSLTILLLIIWELLGILAYEWVTKIMGPPPKPRILFRIFIYMGGLYSLSVTFVLWVVNKRTL